MAEDPESVKDQTSDSDGKSATSLQQGQKPLMEKEQNTIRTRMMIVLFVLLLAGITASVLTFLLTDEWERNDFETQARRNSETQFIRLAEEMNNTAKLMSSNRHFASESMSTALTSFADASEQTWPNVTVNNIERFCNSYQGSTGAHSVFVAPMVEYDDSWNAYSVASQGWLEHQSRTGPTVDRIEPQMFFREDGKNVPQDNSLIAFPIWQGCHLPAWLDPKVVNFNLLSIPQINDAIGIARVSKGPVVTDIVDLSAELGVTVDWEGIDSTPKSAFIHPILRNNEEDKSVGIIMGFMPWTEVISELYGGSDVVILIVLRNTCGETHSFRTDVNGETTYVGPGDSYVDEKLRNLEQVVFFSSQGLGLGTGQLRKCTITLHLFPTEEMERDSYQSDRAQVYTGVVAGVFLFTCLLFCVFIKFLRLN